MSSKGDIVLLPFPFTDLGNSKVRPAVIVSNDKLNKTEDCIFAAISSVPKNDQFSFFIDNKDLTNPLKLKSQVRIHKIFTGQKKLILKAISKLKTEKQKELATKIKELL